MKYHLIGVGGIGMSALAQFLIAKGHEVTGSDIEEGDEVKKLMSLGITIFIGHEKNNVKGRDVVVYNWAIPKENPEYAEAKKDGIRTIHRSLATAELFKDSYQIGIAGTHGKTTTTAMVAAILVEAGLDPWVLLGGNIEPYGNARVGTGEYFVFEADEFGNSFLDFSPTAAIINNIESDHLDFFGDFEHVLQAFTTFAKNTKKVLVAGKDVNKKVVQAFGGKLISVGQDQIDEAKKNLKLQVPGEHNLWNAVMALKLALELGVEEETAISALENFTGVERRIQVYHDAPEFTLIDDYAHHPTEVAVTLEAVREKYPGRKIITVFQPHQYSRTKTFLTEFATELAKSDEVVLVPIFRVRDTDYAARSVTIDDLAAEIKKRNEKVMVIGDYEEVAEYIVSKSKSESGNVFVTMGAAPINEAARKVMEKL